MKKLKRIVTSLIAVSMAAAVSSQISFAQTYTDVPETHWAYNAVERCNKSSWFSGYPDGSFHPNDNITRSEACKVFVTFMSEPLSTVTSSSFYDVSPTAWYAPYVEAGKDLFPKRSSLDGQQKFQPEMPVTREDTIYALVKALGYEYKTQFADLSVLNMFSDQNSITASVKPYVAVAVENGLASGYADGTIGAQDPLSRAEFASLLYRGTFVGVDDTNASYIKKQIANISIEPSTMKEVTIGDSFEITSSVAYSDGSAEDYTNNINPYTSSADGIVVINKNKITAVGEGTAIINFNNDNMRDMNLVVVVKKPTDAPAISLGSYDDETEESTAVIKGTVTDPTGTAITLTVDGKAVAVNSDGSFEATVSLSEGDNDIEISAKNAYGNESKQSVTIVKKAAPTPAPTASPEPEPEPAAATATPEPEGDTE